MAERNELTGLTICVKQGNGNCVAGNLGGAEVHHNVILLGGHGETRIVDEIVPLTRKPLIGPLTVHYGGGRTYGGGLSKEARNRAHGKMKKGR